MSRDIDFLRHKATQVALLEPLVAQLSMIHHYIAERCPDAVLWSVAFGPFLRLLADGAATRKRVVQESMEVLTITSLESIYEAHVLLAEQVFGPVAYEFTTYINHDVWSAAEFRTAIEHDRKWRRVMEEGISIYGSPSRVFELSVP